MSIIINQGKQDVSQDNKFEPISEKDVIGQITKITLNKYDSNKIDVCIQLITGLHKNRIIIDRIPYTASDENSWKYRALRKAAGKPYDKDEPASIDIEKLLLSRAVTMDLSVKTYKDKTTGEDKEFQNVAYKKMKETETKDADDYTEEDVTSTGTPKEAEAKEDFIDESDWV